MSIVNAILKAKIEGIICEVMAKTNAANVYVDDTTTLSTKLAEIITDVSTKASTTQLNEGLSTRASTSHTHTQAEVAGLTDALAERPTTTAMNTAISTAISNLVNGAPETYDTLKEIADYISSHQDVVDTLNAAIGQKADKATTLAGYGITDAMTATQINQAIQNALSGISGNYDASGAAAQALTDAKAYTDAKLGEKSKIYFSSTEPTGLAEGDLWVHIQ